MSDPRALSRRAVLRLTGLGAVAVRQRVIWIVFAMEPERCDGGARGASRLKSAWLIEVAVEQLSRRQPPTKFITARD